MAASAVVAFALLHINTNIQFPQAGSTQIRYYNTVTPELYGLTKPVCRQRHISRQPILHQTILFVLCFVFCSLIQITLLTALTALSNTT